MRVAALDLGTNTFLLLVAEVENGHVVKVLHDQATVVRLGKGIHQLRQFHPDAMKRAEECFKAYAEVIQRYQVKAVKACATSAARDATNSKDLLAMGQRHGIPIEIISGVKEAELTFAGTLAPTDQGKVMLMDVGGGSTEFILGDRGQLKERMSLDIGSVRLTEMFFTKHPIPKSEREALQAFIDTAIKKLPSSFHASLDTAIAVAGTATTLATLDQGLAFESSRVDGHCLTTIGLEQWVSRLSDMSVEQRCALAGMEPQRADVLVAGAAIFARAAHLLGLKQMRVSIRGLRYGLAREIGSH